MTGRLQAYAVTASATLTTNPVDLLTLLSSDGSKLRIREVRLGLTSSALGDLQGLPVEFWRGSTGSPAGGAVTPVPLQGHSAEPAANFAANGPSSAVISTTSAVRLFADTLDDSGLSYCPDDCLAPVIDINQRFHVRLGAPSAGVTVYAYAVVEQLGRIPL